jgi:alpha-mannosidase
MIYCEYSFSDKGVIMASSITTLLVIPHTHWDREWYQTFQQFRMRLVKCINHLLLILDTDPDFTSFMLDGQTILLDDYLEIRPEETEHLLNYVRAGRILVGPWYIQPDEFLVGGEAMIRNLLLGTQQAAPYGGAMPIGYVPDCFGHIAQLPQIFQGFGIDNVIFWRGIDSRIEKSEFWWDAPNGSRVLAVYLNGEMGYSNARDLPLDAEALLLRIERIVSQQSPHAISSMLLLMNGSDHLEPQDGLPAILAAANLKLAEQEQHLAIGTLPQYVQTIQDAEPELEVFSQEFRASQIVHLLPGVLSTRMWIKQRNTACEELLTRWVEPLSAWSWALTGRYPEGLLTAAWRLLLQNQPHDSICGTSIDQVHREMSVRYDQCEQIATQLVQDALLELLQHVDIQTIVPTTTAASEDNSIPLVVLNPVEAQSSTLAEISLQVYTPPDQLLLLDEVGAVVPHVVEVTDGAEILNVVVDSDLLASFLPLLAEGKVTDYFIVNLVFDETQRDELGNFMLWATVSATLPPRRLYTPGMVDRVRTALQSAESTQWSVKAIESPHVSLRFLARDLPAFGGRAYLLSTMRTHETVLPASEMVASERSIENSLLLIEVEPANGTLTMTDKISSTVYAGLHCFQDGGDVGDLYNWTPPTEDTLLTQPAEPPTIELLSVDALQATLRITWHFKLPVSCSADRQTRHTELVDCPVTTDVTLVAGSNTVRFHTVVTNQAQDHRLRVHFPTSIITDTADADGIFLVNRRPVRQTVPPEGWEEWIEEPVNTHPQKRFVSVADAQHGFALLNRGLPEYEVLPAEAEAGVTIALTLLRCVGWLSRGDLANRRGPAGPILPTPEAQLPGTWSFDYAIYPYTGSWETNAPVVQSAANAFNAGVKVMSTGLHIGRLEPTWSFVRLEPPELVLSTLKRSADGTSLILRWYNTLNTDVTADITTALDFVQADYVSLNEETRSSLPGEEDAPTRHWRASTPAHSIQTLRLSLA